MNLELKTLDVILEKCMNRKYKIFFNDSVFLMALDNKLLINEAEYLLYSE